MLRRGRASRPASGTAPRRLNKYIELEPSDEYGYLNRARIYLAMDKPEKALEDANKAIALKPDEPDGYYRRADVYTAMKKDAEAKADEKKADRAGRQSPQLMPGFNSARTAPRRSSTGSSRASSVASAARGAASFTTTIRHPSSPQSSSMKDRSCSRATAPGHAASTG